MMKPYVPLSQFLTTPMFWSCNCPAPDHVHPGTDSKCDRCDAWQFTHDALVIDVLRHYYDLDLTTTQIADWITEYHLDQDFHNLSANLGATRVRAAYMLCLTAVREIKRAVFDATGPERIHQVNGWTVSYYVHLNYARELCGLDKVDTIRLHWSTTAQAAKLLGANRRTIQKWCKSGKIKDAFIMGRDWTIPTVNLIDLKKGPSRW